MLQSPQGAVGGGVRRGGRRAVPLREAIDGCAFEGGGGGHVGRVTAGAREPPAHSGVRSSIPVRASANASPGALISASDRV